ncbi:hypothetical protein BKA80DRAFT_60545 [Phyllosticta citrichinensis]
MATSSIEKETMRLCPEFWPIDTFHFFQVKAVERVSPLVHDCKGTHRTVLELEAGWSCRGCQSMLCSTATQMKGLGPLTQTELLTRRKLLLCGWIRGMFLWLVSRMCLHLGTASVWTMIAPSLHRQEGACMVHFPSDICGTKRVAPFTRRKRGSTLSSSTRFTGCLVLRLDRKHLGYFAC